MLLDLLQVLANKSAYSLEYLKLLVAQILMSIPIIMLTLSVHETAHGYIANKLGDPTARNFGRLTLNPIKHFDPLGLLLMMTVGYGWAKPVPINTGYFKNPKRDMAICAAAGPISNLLLAVLFAGLYKLMLVGTAAVAIPNMTVYNVLMLTALFFQLGVSINVMLAIFNLIPIPPFDGSRIALAFLPAHIYFKIQRYERYIFLGFFLLLLTGFLDGPLSFARNTVTNLIYRLFGII